MASVSPAPRVIRAILAQYSSSAPVSASSLNASDVGDDALLADLADFLAAELNCDPVSGRCPLAEADAVSAVIADPVVDFGLISDSTDPAHVALTLSLLSDDLWTALQNPNAYPLPEDDDSDDSDDSPFPLGHCELCARGPMRLSFHHLIPRKTHAKMLKKGLFTKEEMHSRGAMVCRPCHSTIHRFFDHETLALERNTVDKLLESAKVRRWVEYQSKQAIRQRVVPRMSGRAVARGSAEVVRVGRG